ncbi:MAG: glycosyltransferase [Hydrogenibacillus sp.]|nr:glycosyltransferase [Hydrogenibacillus sp.]
MSKRLHVLHVIGGGEFGGAEQHLLGLARALHAEGQDIVLHIVTIYDGLLAQRLREMGIQPTVLQQSGRFDVSLHRQLVALFDRLKPDIVHTHGVRANFFGRFAGMCAGTARLVTTVHSFLRYDYPLRREFALAWTMEHLSRPLVDHTVTVSEALRRALIADGLAPERVTVIENGIDLTPFREARRRMAADPAARRTAREALGLKPEAFVWATTARLTPVKGLDVLLRAFARVKAKDAFAPGSIQLLVIGQGPLRRGLQELSRTLGLAADVVWLGHRDDVPFLLSLADGFVLPSRQEGGFPLALIEALAADLPAVATTIPAIRDVVGDGGEPPLALVPPDDDEALAAALVCLTQDAAQRSASIARARALLTRRFSLEAFGRRHRTLYTRLMDDRP